MAQQYPVSWPKMQNQVKGIFAYHDTRPGATSRRGQERSTGGILRGVALRESSGVDLAELTVTPLDVSASSARLVVEATLRNWTGTQRDGDASTATIRRRALDGRAGTCPVHFERRRAGRASLAARVEVRVDHPHLWWSWDYGRPDLYELDVGPHRRRPGALDERTVRFGIRSITLDDDWVFRLNGQRIYPRGTNYIATQWLSQADRDVLRARPAADARREPELGPRARAPRAARVLRPRRRARAHGLAGLPAAVGLHRHAARSATRRSRRSRT